MGGLNDHFMCYFYKRVLQYVLEVIRIYLLLPEARVEDVAIYIYAVRDFSTIDVTPPPDYLRAHEIESSYGQINLLPKSISLRNLSGTPCGLSSVCLHPSILKFQHWCTFTLAMLQYGLTYGISYKKV